MRRTSCVIMSFMLFNCLHAQYRLPANVLGGGGGVISNVNFRMSSTVGQSFNGYIQGGNFRIHVGFWRPAQLLTPVEVEEVSEIIPTEYRLDQNYPNPFNPMTTISFALPTKSYVSLKVFDALGREASILFADELTAGTYARQWNAAGMASGVYFYRIQAGSFVKTKKLVLLK